MICSVSQQGLPLKGAWTRTHQTHHEVHLAKEFRVILIDVLEASNENLVIHCVDPRSFFVDGSVSHIKDKLEVIQSTSLISYRRLCQRAMNRGWKARVLQRSPWAQSKGMIWCSSPLQRIWSSGIPVMKNLIVGISSNIDRVTRGVVIGSCMPS